MRRQRIDLTFVTLELVGGYRFEFPVKNIDVTEDHVDFSLFRLNSLNIGPVAQSDIVVLYLETRSVLVPEDDVKIYTGES